MQRVFQQAEVVAARLLRRACRVPSPQSTASASPMSLAPMLTTAVRLVGASNSKSLSSAIAQILSSP